MSSPSPPVPPAPRMMTRSMHGIVLPNKCYFNHVAMDDPSTSDSLSPLRTSVAIALWDDR
jgi:hypothetical protein